MATSESAEIEAVKIQLEAILEEQGKQIVELQQRMNQDTVNSKSFESQLAQERELWTNKEKVFSNKVKKLEKELADLKHIFEHEAHPEKVLLSKMSKDVAQKEQLITGLKNNLGKEQSRNKELEQQVLQLLQQLRQQHGQNIASTEKGNIKTRMKKGFPKGNTAEQERTEKTLQRASPSSGENVKSEVEGDDVLESVSILFDLQPDSAEESELNPYSKENLRVDYPECCHCHKILVDHLILPCGHGYCIPCIQGLKTEEGFCCCICKVQFATDLQNHLKIPLQVKRSVRNLAMNSKRPCECCVRQTKKDILDSEFFCIQCRLCTCSECSHDHIRQSLPNSPHLILAIRIPISRSEALEQEQDLCSEHPDGPLDNYCVSCKHLICRKCFTSHYDHSLLSINDYSNAVKDNIKVKLSEINGHIVYLTQMSNGFKTLEKDSHQRIWRIRETIAKNMDFMTYWLQKQAWTLNKELDFIEKLGNDEVKSTQNDFEDCLSDLKQFRRYAEEFINGTMPSHMANFEEDLYERARELTEAAIEKKQFLENLGVCKEEHVIHPVDISFAPNRPKLQTNARNLVGELKIRTVNGWAAVKLNPKLIHSIEPSVVGNEEKEFAGLTTLGDELFIATRSKSSIEVYDLKTFEHKHFLSGMTNISDITACTTNHCLYMYGSKGAFKGLLKLDLRAGLDPEEVCVVDYDAGRLSVTAACNIVVTGCNTNRLSEYTAEGKLNLELRLEPETGVVHLWHALKTECGYFVVSHGVVSDAVQGICLVDQGGMVLRSYGGNCRDHLDIPMYLAFGQRGSILVADLNNRRVLQLNAFLELNEELISSKEGLHWPCRIHYDSFNCKLFITNSTFLENWEVLIFDTS